MCIRDSHPTVLLRLRRRSLGGRPAAPGMPPTGPGHGAADARRALVAKGRDEYHALRRANGDLKSQRDGLVDEVAALKKELAQTRLVLPGMEYYAAGHQHQTMAL